MFKVWLSLHFLRFNSMINSTFDLELYLSNLEPFLEDLDRGKCPGRIRE
uniref:Uncharacterized protein n=1 Tax=Rhizophora mucronata TaxID=61149 RepID=A0A2P2QAB7_RHIMU